MDNDELALFAGAVRRAAAKGLHLVQSGSGYRLTGYGRTIHVGQVEDASKAVHRFTKAPLGGLAGAVGATALDLPENALQAVLANV